MTTVQEIQKRNGKAQNLRAIQVGDGEYFVESETGGICYRVLYQEGKENACTCGDFAKNIKGDPQFKCKHILAIMNCEHGIETAKFLERAKPKLDPRYVVTIEGQDFVRFSGLLDVAHQKRLTGMEVEILQYPTKENEKSAICKARAVTALGEVYQDIGDANPTNCNAKVAKHLIRMASTRAKSRCLRDLTNIGMTALEELAELDEVIGVEERGTVHKVKPFPKKVVQPEAQPGNGNGGPSAARAADAGKTAGNAPSPGNRDVKEPLKKAEETTKPDNGGKQPEAKTSEKSGGNGKGKAKTDTPPSMSEAQRNAIYNVSRRRGISVQELEKMSQATYGVTLSKLSVSDASTFIRNLQQSA